MHIQLTIGVQTLNRFNWSLIGPSNPQLVKHILPNEREGAKYTWINQA